MHCTLERRHRIKDASGYKHLELYKVGGGDITEGCFLVLALGRVETSLVPRRL